MLSIITESFISSLMIDTSVPVTPNDLVSSMSRYLISGHETHQAHDIPYGCETLMITFRGMYHGLGQRDNELNLMLRPRTLVDVKRTITIATAVFSCLRNQHLTLAQRRVGEERCSDFINTLGNKDCMTLYSSLSLRICSHLPMIGQ